ncbi:hypothetical protein DPMN_024133 [Dreissena polymorpha]|uniref:Uncharacterized protein n=1 Tax=Dreissena polymorpha TaxID=45954 RepID=A0A9D4LQV2_DREPO|nr:hypothetical protein DPMN_024133 [Dreissena polymorpha]
MNVASRVKNAQPLCSHVFQESITIFELIQYIIETNLLTKFPEDWTINVASRVLTRFYYSNILPYKVKFTHLGSHVFQANLTIFELIRDIIKTNLLTKFLEDWTINVASRVLTRKNAPPLGSHTNLLTKIHEDRKINVASRVKKEQDMCLSETLLVGEHKNPPPPGGHVFQPTHIIF